MMQRYEPIRGMYICVEGGSYVLYSDHLAVVAEKNKEYQTLLSHHEEQMGDSMGKITCLKTTLAEKDAEITALKERVGELLQRIVDLENDANEFPTIAEFSNLQDDKEALELRNRTLTDAVSAHIKVCRGWFGDDHVWEQIIAHNEWEGKG